jgi:glycosyltransferase involved in cell wall biosynthesis
LPVVATDVGGVADLVAGRGLVCPPSDAHASVRAVERMISDTDLREQFVAAARAVAADHTLEAEAARVARFLSANH